MENDLLTKVAIIGGGPSGLFMLKRIIEKNPRNVKITIYEKNQQLGSGMPYSKEGALKEHVTNVSDNEIPEIKYSIHEWVNKYPEKSSPYCISESNFNEYKVLPRLMFGEYLQSQFEELIEKAHDLKIPMEVLTNQTVTDIKYNRQVKYATVYTEGNQRDYDKVIICIGHFWPKTNEGKIPGYFDSPYPPKKLEQKLNNPIAITGASLTAIDAIRTLARNNGTYLKDSNGKLSYKLDEGSEDFKIVMHSRNGFLPAVRFHLNDSHLQNGDLLTEDELAEHRANNGGFLSLDFIFENNFKRLFIKQDIEFYETIKDYSIEEFVESMLKLREEIDAFQLLKSEYKEAEKSIKRKESIYWKEALGILSFAMNQPAKHFSAEDYLRLKKTLLPLISIVIAYVPQSSCDELIALYDKGVLDLVAVGDESRVEPENRGGVTYHFKDEDVNEVANYYPTYINCIGQPPIPLHSFPFKGLLDGKTLSQAMYKFQSKKAAEKLMQESPDDVLEINQEHFLKVSGLAINDNFQVLSNENVANEQIYIMAVPYISGFNPDYSGLDFCEAASEKIVESLFN